jgi:hypothetical protein
MQAENVVEKRDSKGSKKLRQKSSILPPEIGVKIANKFMFKCRSNARISNKTEKEELKGRK